LAHQMGLALALPFTGLILELTGYNGLMEVQSEPALKGILTLGTLLPAGFTFISFIFLWLYPVSKKKYHLLHQALELKKAGESYSTDGFEDILC